MRKILTLLLAFALIHPAAHAERAPRPISTDNRIKQFSYTPNQVFEVRGTYGFVMSIEFADNEDMKGVFVGDSVAWQIAPRPPKGNRLFLKPMEDNANTNLTVVTALPDGTQRTYLFSLGTAKKQTDTTFSVRFVYPRNDAFASLQPDQTGKTEKSVEGGRGAGGSPSGVYMYSNSYSVAGTDAAKRAIRLRSVHDDGQFTYFRFEPGSDIPGIYVVGADGYESTVNQRREGDYMVVEKVSAKFTLRRDALYLCIRNDKRALEDKTAPSRITTGNTNTNSSLMFGAH